MLIDISRTLFPGSPHWPGDSPTAFHLNARIADGASCNVGELRLSVHNGTHADAPFGELVGISKISAELARQLAAHAAEAHSSADYESAVVRAAGETPIACLRVDDLLWGEIDDEAMLAN